MSKKAVTTVVCPVDRLPDDFQRKRRFDSEKPDRSGVSFMNKKPRFGGSHGDKAASSSSTSTKEELRTIMKSIKEFNTEALFGKEKRKTAQDMLTDLGCMPLKQQTMPLKMRLAIQEGRKKKEKGRTEIAKASGVVTANTAQTLKKMKDRKESRKARK